MLCLVAQSCLTLCNRIDCSLPGFSVHGDSPGKNTGVSCHALLQGIFPTQEWNPDLPHWRWILYRLSHQGSPRNYGVDSLSLLQGIFPNQELNRILLHCRQILYQLRYKGSPLYNIVIQYFYTFQNDHHNVSSSSVTIQRYCIIVTFCTLYILPPLSLLTKGCLYLFISKYNFLTFHFLDTFIDYLLWKMRIGLSYTIIYIHFIYVHSFNILLSQFRVKSIFCVYVYKSVNISFLFFNGWVMLWLSSHFISCISFLFFLELIIASGPPLPPVVC